MAPMGGLGVVAASAASSARPPAAREPKRRTDDVRGESRREKASASFERMGPRGVAKRVAAAVAAIVVLTAAAATYQLLRPVPLPHLVPTARRAVVPGTPPSIPWPVNGEAALAVGGIGDIGHSGPSKPVPIASLTKLMTAYLVLADHPLKPGQTGPLITISGADAANYTSELAQQDSVAAVVAGEKLTELQALEALLIPSADNIAPVLARWDAGSRSAFVAKMNRTAKLLGMAHTHYADTSGLSSASVSDAVDQLRLGQIEMRNPVFAQIVGMAQVTLPVAGVLENFNYDLGQDGIVGIKTGSTPAAGGCLVFDARVPAGGATRNIYGAVIGERSSTSILMKVLAKGLALVSAAQSQVGSRQVAAAGAPLGRLVAADGASVAVRSTSAVHLAGWGGLPLRVSTSSVPLRQASVPAGTQVGSATYSAGGETAATGLVAAGRLPPPGILWRLSRG